MNRMVGCGQVLGAQKAPQTYSLVRIMMHESRLDPGVTEQAIRSELDHILAGPDFRASKRCQDFLKFVVERTLAGTPDSLKERTIGIEVFGRLPSYDTSSDGIVRINASDVRKRLAIHYADPSRNAELRVTLPVGSYIPTFSKVGKGAVNDDLLHARETSSTGFAAASGVGPTIERTHRGPRSRRKVLLWTVALVLVAAILPLRWFDVRLSRTIVDQFWQPLLDGSTPVLIVPAYVPVYSPTFHPTPHSSPFTLLTDQYVGGGDLVAAVQVSSMILHMGHPMSLRMGTEVSLDDLRNTPTVLIGYSSTQWADVTKKFRFFVDDSSFGMIRDNGNPTDWYPHRETLEQHTDEDYAVISRAFDVETHSMLILISGCMQYGTEAAARLITSPELLSVALHDAPKDWQRKNLQLVIHVDVVANSPGSSKVVAAYYW